MSASNPAGTVPDNKLPNLVEVKKILNAKKWMGALKVQANKYQLYCCLCFQFNPTNKKSIYLNKKNYTQISRFNEH